MSFLNDGKRTIKADVRYDQIYTQLNSKTRMTISEIFYLCVLLGFKNNRKSDEFQSGRKEFRVTYFNESQRSILYAISNEIHEISELSQPENLNEVIKEIQKYSNGGMDILIENVFEDRYRDGSLLDSYSNYDIDILKYIYDELTEVPF